MHQTVRRSRENQELRLRNGQLLRQSQQDQSNARSQLETMRTERNSARFEMENAVSQLQKTRQEYADLSKKLQSKEQDLSALNQQNALLNAKVEDLQTLVSEIRSNSSQKLADRNAGMVLLEAEARKLLKSTEELQQALAKAQADQGAAVAGYERAQKEIATLRRNLAEAAAQPPVNLEPEPGSPADQVVTQIKNVAAVACRALSDAFFELQQAIINALDAFFKVKDQISDPVAAQRLRDSLNIVVEQARLARSCLDGLRALTN